MSFVVLRGENGFKGRSSVGFDGTGCSREKPKWIISREAFLLGVWVAEFPFNHQTSDSAHLYNHHQQFLQLQLVCNFHPEGEKEQVQTSKSAVCGVIPPYKTTSVLSSGQHSAQILLSYKSCKQNCCHTVIVLLHQANILSTLKRMNHSTL